LSSWMQIIDVLITVPQMVVTVICFNVCMKFKKPVLFGFCYCAYCTLLYLLPKFIAFSLLPKMVILVVGSALVAYPFCEKPFTNYLIFHIYNCTVQVLVDIIVSTLMIFSIGINSLESFNNMNTMLFAKSFCFVLYTFFLWLFTVFWRKKTNIRGTVPATFITLFGSQILICVSMFDMGLRVKITAALTVMELLAVVACFLCDFLLLRYIRQLENHHQVVMEKQIAELQLRSQIEHYDQLVNTIEDVGKLRHDVNNQLQTIYALLSSGETQIARTETDALQERWNAIHMERHCANKLLDALISEKEKACAAKMVTLEAKLDVPEGIALEGLDLCSLFSNILDNAIQAASIVKDGDRKISLEAYLSAHRLSITASNTYDPKSPKENPSIGHGYGLQIIKSIAEKYNGGINVTTQDESFTISVWLIA
jgi:hypothetical protein